MQAYDVLSDTFASFAYSGSSVFSNATVGFVVTPLGAAGLFLVASGVSSNASSSLPVTGCGPARTYGSSTVGTVAVFVYKGPTIFGESTSAPVSIPLGGGMLHLNQKIVSGNSITQRAIFFDLPGTLSDVVIGETTADINC